MKKIVLIAGHTQGAGEGAQNQVTKETENMITRDFLPKIAEKLKQKLGGKYEVMTLPVTMTLDQKVVWTNKNLTPDDYVLELHLDSSGPRKETGALVYYYGGSEDSKTLAKKLLDAYLLSVKVKNNGLRADTQSRFGQLGIIRNTTGWALLIELGSINNDLEQVKANAVQGVVNGVLAMLGEDRISEHMAWAEGHFPELTVSDDDAYIMRHLAQRMMKDSSLIDAYQTLLDRVALWQINP